MFVVGYIHVHEMDSLDGVHVHGRQTETSPGYLG